MNSKARNIIFSFPITLILIFTLLLLVYIGYGEANRKYAQFQIGKLASQAEVVKNDFEAFLQAGLPLQQFSGFAGISENLILSDPSIENIQVRDIRQQQVFLQGRPGNNPSELQQILQTREYFPATLDLNNDKKGYIVEESAISFRVILPLAGKFGAVGDIIIEAKQSDVFKVLHEDYSKVYYAFSLIVLLFILVVVCYELIFASQKYRKTLHRSAFVISFLLMSLVIGYQVFHIYEKGAEANAKALTDSMAQRLKAIVELGIEFDDISGINQLFQEYKQNNPEISEIAFTDHNVVSFHTNEQFIDKVYERSPEHYNYIVPLDNTRHLLVTLSIPRDIVLNAVFDSLKEFIVLFIASGLIALIFLDSGTQLISLSQFKASQRQPNAQVNEQSYLIGLSLIKPAYFILVFVNGLPISFLPQLVTEMAAETMTFAQMASASLPFTIYYLMFAIVLAPAGYYAERGVSLKKIMAIGFIAEFIGAILIATTSEYWVLVAGRFFSGIGQGIFLIGLQSYILHITPKEDRTRGAAVKVISKNAGQIAGTAIGALLFAYIGYQLLFLIASMLTLVGILYLWTLVPRPSVIVGNNVTSTAKPKPKTGMLEGILNAVKDSEFSRTLLLIGLFGKMNITGVAMFAVPLVLAGSGLATSDIGQALMVYYLSLIIMTQYTSKLVDVWISSRMVLFVSAVIGGIGMLLFGLTMATLPEQGLMLPGGTHLLTLMGQWQTLIANSGIEHLTIYVMLGCLFLLGISNGLSLAPLTTHIAKTNVAEQYGNKSVTATYTFLERSGHVLGPVVITQLLIFTYNMALAVSVFGILVLLFGFIFIFTSQKS